MSIFTTIILLFMIILHILNKTFHYISYYFGIIK